MLSALTSRDWIVLPRARHVCLFDQLPRYRCALAVSWCRIPPETAAYSVGYLMNQTYSAELRPILHRGDVIRYFNVPLEAAWIQLRVMDLEERREALTRLCIARAGCTQALILFDSGLKNELKLFDVWETVLQNSCCRRLHRGPGNRPQTRETRMTDEDDSTGSSNWRDGFTANWGQVLWRTNSCAGVDFRTENQRILIEREKLIKIWYGTQLVGKHRLDALVNSAIIVELKANRGIMPLHLAQIRSYLHATRYPFGSF